MNGVTRVLCLGVLLFGGCAHEAPPQQGGAVQEAEGTVSLTGEARNAFSGAIVRDPGFGVVYVVGLREWPAGWVGRQVRVRGVRSRAKLAPDPVVGADGGVSHGMVGTSQVVRNASWELVTPL